MMRAVLFALAMGVPAAAAAQDAATLADIRGQLSALYGEIEGLRGELSASRTLGTGVAGTTPLDRLNAIEAELQRLTSKTEELEFRINRITVDGTNRIGDLEYRLCEIEPGCDVNLLGDTPSLGGVDSAAAVPEPAAQTETGPSMAVGEQADFDRAKAAHDAADWRGAADQFAVFVQTYPGGALSSQALFFRGVALENLGEVAEAARAFLDSFSGEPEGPVAADALYRLGMALAALGQVPDACVTLGEVPARFPAAAVAGQAQTARADLGCP